ncbi:MAG: hypothetical protein ACOYXC_06015, partial [Candidatus Rifleibacteriota bacterium]
DNSSGKISLNEILDYVNGGSRTVSRDLYNYLVSAGKIKSTTTQTSNTSSQTTSTSSSGSIWNRIFGWFSGLFNRSNSAPVAAAPSASVEISNADIASPAEAPAGATAPELPGGQLDSSISSITDLASAQEAYYKAFADYNRLLAAKGQQSQEVKNALQKLQQAKAKVKELREQLRR